MHFKFWGDGSQAAKDLVDAVVVRSTDNFNWTFIFILAVVFYDGVFATLLLRVFAPVLGIAEGIPSRSRLVGRLVQIAETGLPLAFILACLCVGNRMVRDGAARDGEPTYLRVALVQRNAPCCFKPGKRENAYEAFGQLLDAHTLKLLYGSFVKSFSFL